jgi:hypothetical protein
MFRGHCLDWRRIVGLSDGPETVVSCDDQRQVSDAWRCQLGPRTPEDLARSRRARWKHVLYSAAAEAERQRARQLLRDSLELLKRL